jgi:hypothetical protein
MKRFDIFYNPWGGQIDYFVNILFYIIFIFNMVLLALCLFKKISSTKQTYIATPISTALINCIPIILLKWFLTVPIIILLSILMWYAYTTQIDRDERLQLKNIELTNKWQMEKLEDEYDSSHTKEELEVIMRQAYKYPRMGITKFLFISFITPVLFFITLLLMGYKYIP